MDLTTFFKENSKAAVAFSGGVDSSYLLYAGISAGADVTGYYVKSAFQPMFEYNDAMRLAEQIGARVKVIEVDVLADEKVRQNPSDRCYYCKQGIFGTILRTAAEDGYTLILDGTNASDDEGDRPGMKALRELQVRSPLRECGLTKDMIRQLSREAGLFTWDKPSYACLATRIRTGEEITAEKLSATEDSEDYLFSLGFTDFRVRMRDRDALLQVPSSQFAKVAENREAILAKLKEYYDKVSLDLEVR
ncbi:MAG: ATP-dependent sacrificial sulfur transferase LarE [Oscillospiraceae bacterium]|nr:ATP-dependent sacrificial sulfur transferase LarE [Oscillospiraceae bacterium]MBQ5340733.1 ATP-dependent sacrificial sulfur transferase LarE [Oscillospiraceae bacterium]MBQ5342611.1 ATP-dependent sacrificial sulfur transferase LarE [Oscillospiraceae bacterium]